ncbi:MAG: hypothetical protein EP349_02340, partial [Alphaproteobacteria bacterium]
MKKIALVLSLGATILTAGCGHPVYEVQNFGKWFGEKVTNDGGYEVATREAFVLKPPPAPQQPDPGLQALPGTGMSSGMPPPMAAAPAPDEAEYQDLWGEPPVEGMSPEPETVMAMPARPPVRETAPAPQPVQTVVLEPAPGLNPWQEPQRAPRPSLIMSEAQRQPEPDYYPPLVPVRQRPPEQYGDGGAETYSGGSVTVFSLDDMPASGGMRPVNDTRSGSYHVGGGYEMAQYDGSSVTVNRYPDIFGDDDAFAPVAAYGTAGTTPYDRPKLMATSVDNALYFNYGSSRIDENDRRLIREFARAAAGRTVHVSGHASRAVFSTNDPGERRAINLQMSA